MCLNQYDFPYENRGGKAIGQSGIGERAQVVANTKPGEGGGRWNKNNEGSFESVGVDYQNTVNDTRYQLSKSPLQRCSV